MQNISRNRIRDSKGEKQKTKKCEEAFEKQKKVFGGTCLQIKKNYLRKG